MESLGYLGVAALMLLENVFPPIPSEVIMPLAGFAASRGDLTLWGVIVAGSVGSLLGQYPLYYLGRTLGQARLHRLADRYGVWLAVSGADIDRASDWLRRHGPLAVLLCRLVPGVRSLISIPAGISRMNLWVFTLYSTVGMTVWTALLAWLGYVLGDQYERVAAAAGPVGTWIWIGLGLALVGWIAWRLRGCYMHARVSVSCPFRDSDKPADPTPPAADGPDA